MSIYFIDDNGQQRDKGLVDPMLENEDKITEQLVEKGVVRQIKVRPLEELPPDLQERYREIVRTRKFDSEEAEELGKEIAAYRFLRQSYIDAGLPWED